jgi:hypothetical protein
MPARAYVPVSGHETNHDGCVQLRYSYRLCPTPGQQQALARAFGCARVVFNDGLTAQREGMRPGSRTSPTRRCRPG